MQQEFADPGGSGASELEPKRQNYGAHFLQFRVPADSGPIRTVAILAFRTAGKLSVILLYILPFSTSGLLSFEGFRSSFSTVAALCS